MSVGQRQSQEKFQQNQSRQMMKTKSKLCVEDYLPSDSISQDLSVEFPEFPPVMENDKLQEAEKLVKHTEMQLLKCLSNSGNKLRQIAFPNENDLQISDPDDDDFRLYLKNLVTSNIVDPTLIVCSTEKVMHRYQDVRQPSSSKTPRKMANNDKDLRQTILKNEAISLVEKSKTPEEQLPTERKKYNTTVLSKMHKYQDVRQPLSSKTPRKMVNNDKDLRQTILKNEAISLVEKSKTPEEQLPTERKKYNTPVSSQASLYKDYFPSHAGNKYTIQNVNVASVNTDYVEASCFTKSTSGNLTEKQFHASNTVLMVDSVSRQTRLNNTQEKTMFTQKKTANSVKRTSSLSEYYPEDSDTSGDLAHCNRRCRSRKGKKHDSCERHFFRRHLTGKTLRKNIDFLANYEGFPKKTSKNVKVETVMSTYNSDNKNKVSTNKLEFHLLPQFSIHPEMTIKKLPSIDISDTDVLTDSFQRSNVGYYSFVHEETHHSKAKFSPAQPCHFESSKKYKPSDNNEVIKEYQRVHTQNQSHHNDHFSMHKEEKNSVGEKVHGSGSKYFDTVDNAKKSSDKSKKGVTFYTPDNKKHFYDPDSPVSATSSSPRSEIQTDEASPSTSTEETAKKLVEIICKFRRKMQIQNELRRLPESSGRECPHLKPCSVLQGRELGCLVGSLLNKYRSEQREQVDDCDTECIQVLERISSLHGMVPSTSAATMQCRPLGFSGLVTTTSPSSEDDQPLEEQEECDEMDSHSPAPSLTDEMSVNKKLNHEKSNEIEEETEPEYEDDWDEDIENEEENGKDNEEKLQGEENEQNEKGDTENGGGGTRECDAASDKQEHSYEDDDCKDDSATRRPHNDTSQPSEESSPNKNDNKSCYREDEISSVVMNKLINLSLGIPSQKNMAETNRISSEKTKESSDCMINSLSEVHKIFTSEKDKNTAVLNNFSQHRMHYDRYKAHSSTLPQEIPTTISTGSEAMSVHQTEDPHISSVRLPMTSEFSNLCPSTSTPSRYFNSALSEANHFMSASYAQNNTDHISDAYFVSQNNSLYQPVSSHDLRNISMNPTSSDLILEPLTPSYYRFTTLRNSPHPPNTSGLILPHSVLQQEPRELPVTVGTQQIAHDMLAHGAQMIQNPNQPYLLAREPYITFQNNVVQPHIRAGSEPYQHSTSSVRDTTLQQFSHPEFFHTDTLMKETTVPKTTSQIPPSFLRTVSPSSTFHHGSNVSNIAQQGVSHSRPTLEHKSVQASPLSEKYFERNKTLEDKEIQVRFNMFGRNKIKNHYSQKTSSSSTIDPLSSSSATVDHVLSDVSEGEVKQHIYETHFGELHKPGQCDCDYSDGEFIFCPHNYSLKYPLTDMNAATYGNTEAPQNLSSECHSDATIQSLPELHSSSYSS